mgnify:FL=1
MVARFLIDDILADQEAAKLAGPKYEYPVGLSMSTSDDDETDKTNEALNNIVNVDLIKNLIANNTAQQSDNLIIPPIKPNTTIYDNNFENFSNTTTPTFTGDLEPSYAGLNTDAAVADKKGFSLKSLIPFAEGSMSRNILEGIASLAPKMDPRQVALRDLYGYTSTGSVPSGLMQGYNPVSGGGLYTLTGGKFGEPPTYGLQKAYQKRMDTIEKTLGNKYGLTDAQIQDIYAGTYDEEDYNFDTALVQRLQDLKAAKDKEFQILQSVTPGSSNDGYINFTGSKDKPDITTTQAGGGSDYQDTFTGGGQYAAGGEFSTAPAPQRDYSTHSAYGLKKGGLVSIL